MPSHARLIDHVAALLRDGDLLGSHLVLRQVVHIDLVVHHSAGTQLELRKVDILQVETLHQLAAKVKPCRRSHDSPLRLSVYGLVPLSIIRRRLALDIVGQRRHAEVLQILDEVVMIPVVEEAKGTTTGGGVVDHLSNQPLIVTKEELIPDPDLTSRVHEDIPEIVLRLQLTHQEYLDAGIRLLLMSHEVGREDLRIIEDNHVILSEVLDQILKLSMLDLPTLAVEHHHPRLITKVCRMLSNQFLGQLEAKL